MPICPHGHQSQTADYCDYCGTPMGSPVTAAPQPPAQHAMPGGQPGPGGVATPTAGLPMCPICSTPRTGQYCEECGYNWELAAPLGGARVGGSAPQPPVTAPPAPPAPQVPAPPVAVPPYEAPVSAPSYQAPPVAAPPYQAPPAQSPPPLSGGYGGYVTGETNGGAGTEYFLAPPLQQTPDYTGQQQGAGQSSAGAPPAARRGTWIAVVTADREYFADMMARSGPEAAGLYFPPFSPERRVPMTGQGQLRIGRRSHQRGTVPEIDLSIAPEDPGASHQHALLQEQPDGSWVVIDQDSTNGTTLNGAPDTLPAFVPVELKDGDRIHVGAWTTITVHCA